jgi:hypothetical protein
MSPQADPEQLQIEEISQLVFRLLLYTNRGLAKLCAPVIRKGLYDAGVILGSNNNHCILLAIHVNSKVRATRIDKATCGCCYIGHGRSGEGCDGVRDVDNNLTGSHLDNGDYSGRNE